MTEALVIVGLASTIVQFVDFSTKIIQRLDEFQSRVGEVPQTFRDLKIQLPLLRDTLKRAKAETEAGLIDADTQRAVLDVVEGCQLQVKRLDNILIKTLPTPADSRSCQCWTPDGKKHRQAGLPTAVAKRDQDPLCDTMP
jgi:hypothetical protein